MKHAQSFAAAFLALMIVGCGGSGGGHSSTGTTSPNLSTPRIEAIVRVERTNLNHPNAWTDDQLADPTNLNVKADLIDPTVFGYQDPTNFQTTERYIFQLAAYQPDGTRVILPATFQTLDVSQTYGNLGTNSGAFDASANTTISDQTIIATYNGASFEALYDIRERRARLLGAIQNQTTKAGVFGVVVDFYDPFGNLVDKVTTAVDGSFRASVPIQASTFTVDPHSLGLNFFNVFGYVGKTYLAGNVDCLAGLPGLSLGAQSFSAPFLIVPATAGATQPATDGCVAGP